MAENGDSKDDKGTGVKDEGSHPSPRVATTAAANPLRGLELDSPMTPTEIGSEETLAATPADQITARERPAAIRGEAPAPAGRGLQGKRLADRYTIGELLGRGGMSEVYVARHELLEKTVAIKVLREELVGSKEALSRFHREAVAAANIGDAHIVDVTDYGFTEEGDAFLVMERLEGQDLRHLLRNEGALPAGRAVAIARQVLRALRAAHESGIVHRDLKAENIFLCQREGADFVKLLDFGISKLQRPVVAEGEQGGPALTATGMVMGTPQYISPEQAHGEPDIDQRADIYSMGVILYEMLTGQLPFSGESAFAVMMKHVQEEPEPLHVRRPDLEVPEALESVVLKAMKKGRDERYSTAQTMLDALPRAKALTGGYESMGTGAVPETAGSRGRVGKWVALVLLLLLGTGTYVMLKASPPSEPAVAVGSDMLAKDSHVATSKDSASPRDAGLERTPVKPARVQVSVAPKSAKIYEGKKLLGKGKITLEGPIGQKRTITVKAWRHGTVTHEIVIDPAKAPPLIRLRPLNRPPRTKSPEDIKGNPYK